MTILATHFSLMLGAWRLRVRIDIDEPRDKPAPRAVRSVRYASGARSPHLHRRVS